MPRYPVTPRPEEGREALPSYSHSVYCEALMCRKLELNTPYMSAIQRSWHLVYVQLNNTQLNVYDITPASSSSSAASKVLKKKLRQSSLPTTTDPSACNTNADQNCITTPRANPHNLPGTLVENATYRVGKLLRSYTLQFAEVGLPIDYNKRANVLRIRAEAEQFLLQTASQEQHIAWTNNVQMGIDIALPLEERELPKYRMIPRRRRRLDNRRRRRTTSSRNTPAVTTNETPATTRSRETFNSSVPTSSSSDFFGRMLNRLRSKKPINSAPVPEVGPTSGGAMTSTAASSIVEIAASGVDAEIINTPSEAVLVERNPIMNSPETQIPEIEIGCSIPDRELTDSTEALTLSSSSNSTEIEQEDSETGEIVDEEEEEEEEIYGEEDSDVDEIDEEEADFLNLIDEYTTEDSSEEDEALMLKKWEPEQPEQSMKSLLKYAHRCLLPLPASAPWLDKLVVHKGHKYIVKRDNLQRCIESPMTLY